MRRVDLYDDVDEGEVHHAEQSEHAEVEVRLDVVAVVGGGAGERFGSGTALAADTLQIHGCVVAEPVDTGAHGDAGVGVGGVGGLLGLALGEDGAGYGVGEHRVSDRVHQGGGVGLDCHVPAGLGLSHERLGGLGGGCAVGCEEVVGDDGDVQADSEHFAVDSVAEVECGLGWFGVVLAPAEQGGGVEDGAGAGGGQGRAEVGGQEVI